MTAAAGSQRPGAVLAGPVLWRRLTWVAWRQHRAALTAFAVLIVLFAIFMAVTGLVLHPAGANVFSAERHSQWPLFDAANTLLKLVLPLMPAVAGLFLGAPLIAREIETGADKFTWVQGAGRTRWFVATVVPGVVLLAVIGAGLGLEYTWWATPLLGLNDTWRLDLLGLRPLPYAGWIVLACTLGVFFGALIRRTVAAMAATFAGYLLLMYEATSWRPRYLPPLHEAGQQPQFNPGGGYGYSLTLGPNHGPGPDILSSNPGWPDGRLLSAPELHHSPAWFRLHDIQIWLTYQPANRFGLFQLIEFGWLIAASAILIAAALVLLRRRPA